MRYFLLFFWFGFVWGGSYYDYHPDLPARLGYGFSVKDTKATYQACFEKSEEDSIDGLGARYTELVLSSVSSQKELLEQFRVSSSISANSYFVNGKAGLSYLSDYQFKENSLTFMISSQVHYGRFGLKHSHLLPQMQALLDQKEYDAFESACGSHLVDQIERGASLYAVYSIHDLSQSQKKQFESYFTLSGNHSVFSAELEASFKSLLLQAAQSSHMDLRIFAIGGEGLKLLAEMPEKVTDLQAVKQMLGTYLRSMDVSRSAILRYHVTSFEIYGLQKESQTYFERDRVLEAYYFRMQEYLSLKEDIESILDSKKPEYAYLSKEDKQEYLKYYKDICTYLDTLQQQAAHCLDNNKTCQFLSHEKPFFPIDWPHNKECRKINGFSRVNLIKPISTPNKWSEEECENARLYAFEKGCLTKKELEDLRLKKGAPVCGFSTGFSAWIKCLGY